MYCLKSDNKSLRGGEKEESFYKKCTKEFTVKNIAKILELRLWLLKKLEEK